MKPIPIYEDINASLYNYDDVKDFVLWWKSFIGKFSRHEHLGPELTPAEAWELQRAARPLKFVGCIEIPRQKFYTAVDDFFDAYYEIKDIT